MSTEKLYRQLIWRETESKARALYERECGCYDLAPWEQQPDSLRDEYRTRVKVVPLFAS